MRAWLAALVCVMGATEARTEPMPNSLRGKSILLSWTNNRILKALSGNHAGTQRADVLFASIKLYVSAQGRVFSLYQKSDRPIPDSQVADNVRREVSGSGGNVLHWRFEAGNLIADEAEVRGARRVAVSFKEQFVSCSVTVIYGKDSGAKQFIFKGTSDGAQYEIIDPKTSSESCSIQQGNIFGEPQ